MLSSIAQRLMSSMIVVLLIVEIVYTWAHPRFQKELPNIANGESIPGKPVLGHISTTYIQDLDAFGEAFRKAGFRWTKEFCQEDSDGDGQSNGHELGDPFCCYIKVSSFYIYFFTLYFIMKLTLRLLFDPHHRGFIICIYTHTNILRMILLDIEVRQILN